MVESKQWVLFILAEEYWEGHGILKGPFFSMDGLDRILHQIHIRLLKSHPDHEEKRESSSDDREAFSEPVDMFNLSDELTDRDSASVVVMEIISESEMMKMESAPSRTVPVQTTRSGRKVKRKTWTDHEMDEIPLSTNGQSRVFTLTKPENRSRTSQEEKVTPRVSNIDDLNNLNPQVVLTKIGAGEIHDVKKQEATEEDSFSQKTESEAGNHEGINDDVDDHDDDDDAASDVTVVYRPEVKVVTPVNSSKDKVPLKKYICEYCGKRFTTNFNMKRHFEGHFDRGKTKAPAIASSKVEDDPLKIHKCEQCGKGFRKRCNLARHEKIHTDAACEICGKTFTTWANLKVHIGSHKAKSYPCKFCGKVLSRKYARWHMNSTCPKNKAIPSNLKKYKCPDCNLSFFYPGDRKKHVAEVHEAIKKYVCDVCGKAFSRGGNLQRHIAGHIGERKFQCPTCDQAFISKFDMKKHVREVHHKIAQYTCEVCGKTFTKNYNRVRHLKSHSLVISYNCRICGEKFDSAQLRREHHKEVHKKRAIPCSMCGVALASRDSVKRHASKVHGVSILLDYQCHICLEKFESVKLVNRHMREHHWQHATDDTV